MLILDKCTHSDEKKLLINSFFNDGIEKYVLGCNENSKQLLNHFKFDGYIDDFSSLNEFNNLPVYKSSSIKNKASIIVSSSLAIYPKTAINNLKSNGFFNILSILDISNEIGFNIIFLSDAKKDIVKNYEKYKKIFELLNDSDSKKIFQNILNFRCNFDLSFMEDYIVDFKRQYFEDFLDLKEGEVFVDVGGYDGATSVEFIKNCPKYKSINIFEPSEFNLVKARENLKGFNNVNFFAKGLSNERATYKFNSDSGSASVISDDGSSSIEVDTLDNLVKEPVSFIKVDIEGWEAMAIEGMKNHILNDHPKLAISVYHKVDDFWKIPEQILSIRNDYKLYMRHYTEGTDETVMFFIPN